METDGDGLIDSHDLYFALCAENAEHVNKEVFYVRFEVFTALTRKSAVFWDVQLCRSCVNQRFGGIYRLHLLGRKICERGTSVSRWLQTKPPDENTQL
jgi:hypothetical protein